MIAVNSLNCVIIQRLYNGVVNVAVLLLTKSNMVVNCCVSEFILWVLWQHLKLTTSVERPGVREKVVVVGLRGLWEMELIRIDTLLTSVRRAL